MRDSIAELQRNQYLKVDLLSRSPRKTPYFSFSVTSSKTTNNRDPVKLTACTTPNIANARNENNHRIVNMWWKSIQEIEAWGCAAGEQLETYAFAKPAASEKRLRRLRHLELPSYRKDRSSH
jgi:hypothetical protein